MSVGLFSTGYLTQLQDFPLSYPGLTSQQRPGVIYLFLLPLICKALSPCMALGSSSPCARLEAA